MRETSWLRLLRKWPFERVVSKSQLSIKLTYPILHLDLTLSLLEKIQSAQEVEAL